MAAPGPTDCSALANSISATVYIPGSPGYATSKTSYFAAFENEVSPLCFVQPKNAKEVAEIIQYVNSLPVSDPTLLAVRSGGHTAWAGSANIEGGITIDLSKLDDIASDAKTGVVSLGVSQQWGDVYSTFAEQGLAVVGGRVSKLGLGGLTLGGDLSYFSEQTGFVCDNVINYEVVLASGKIVQANKDSNPDLFTALTGGSNNFGIVT